MPKTLLEKFAFYRAKYGTAHAAASFVGRGWPAMWKLAAPAVTRGYVRRYLLATPEPALNLGSGSHCIPGMLNVDIDARADAYVDLTRPLFFDDAVFASIYSEEVIEHVDEAQGRRVLADCFRVLRPGGRLRLITPLLDYFAGRLSDADADGAGLNGIFFGHGHRFLYTRARLRRGLEEAGFTDIRDSSYRDPASPLAAHDSHPERFSHPPEISQYVDARRPDAPAATEPAL